MDIKSGPEWTFEKGYPLAEEISSEKQEAEADYLESLSQQVFYMRLWGYLKLGGLGLWGLRPPLGLVR